MPRASQVKNCEFTVEAAAEESIAQIKMLPIFKYGIAQQRPSEDGKIDIRGYVQCAKRMSKTNVELELAIAAKARPIVNAAKLTWKQTYTAIATSGDFTEWGTPTRAKGERTDLKQAHGKPLILEEAPEEKTADIDEDSEEAVRKRIRAKMARARERARAAAEIEPSEEDFLCDAVIACNIREEAPEPPEDARKQASPAKRSRMDMEDTDL